jgi:Tol biopolymer transport system component/DNA-binding winged helix-turn-helix (wHTH) protein
MTFEFDSFKFESDDRILSNAGTPLPLTPKAAMLLLMFLKNPQTLLSKDHLKSRVWSGVHIEDGAITFQVNAIQNALGQRPDGERYIKNVKNQGYRFDAHVKCCSTLAQAAALSVPSAEPSIAKSEPAPAYIADHDARPARSYTRPRNAYVISGVVVALTAVLIYSLVPTPHLSVSRYIPLTHDGLKKGEWFLLADTERIYFKEEGPKVRQLAAVSVVGGGTGPISLPAGYEDIYDLSPQSSELLVGHLAPDQQSRQLWVVPILGRSPAQVGDLRADSANWSPNRRQIAGALDRTLYIANSDGSGRHIVAELPGQVELPRWAPDGKTIRFSEKIPQDGDLLESMWEVRTDGSHLHQLLAGWNSTPHECCGTWTPDGKFFVFQSIQKGRSDLWALSELRTSFRERPRTPVRLSSGLLSYSAPVMSRNGKEIFAIGSEKRGELVRFDSKLKEFVPFLGGIDATWVTFSKSGEWIAYLDRQDLTVWRVKIDGSEKSQISFAPMEADGLTLSPDEKWFAVRGRTPGKPWRIYLFPVDGGEAKMLVPSETDQGIPTWSPDGTRIAFGDIPPVHDVASGAQAIHILKLSDHTLSELPGSQGFWTARWSPDGHSLSALTIEGERLVIYDFGTKKWRSTEAENVNNPTWSRDGKYIYFDTEGRDRALRRVRAADGHVDQLVDLRAYPNLGWWWSGVAPDNSPVILRNLGSTEIYSLVLESR